MSNPPDHLSKSEKLFWHLEFDHQRLSQYPERLKELGFCSKMHVLDLGCGMGQWSYALASLNHNVTAIDKNLSRIAVAKDLFSDEIQNLTFTTGTCENIPFKESTFDAAFVYGVLMFSDWKSTLMELSRVTKPGAIIYLNYNHIGRYIYRLYRPTGSYIIAIRDIVLMLISTILRRKSNVLIDDNDFLEACKRYSFDVLHGPKPEGFISVTKKCTSTPFTFYPSQFLGMRCITEFILIKR